MLMVMTQEVEADMTGFPVEVTAAPCVQEGYGKVEENGEYPLLLGCGECGVRTIYFDSGERADGAAGSRLVIRAKREDLEAMLRSALSYVELPAPG